MRCLFLFIFFLFSFWAGAQKVDTATVRLQVDSLLELNQALVKKHNMDTAMFTIQQAWDICQNGYGVETALCAEVQMHIGRTLVYSGKYAEAEPYYLEAKRLLEKTVGKENGVYVECLGNLGVMYNILGQYETAEPIFINAVTLAKTANGEYHPDYSWCTSILAANYMELGQYEKAESLFLRAIYLNEKTYGKEHEEYAMALNNMAILYDIKGEFEKAEPLYLEAIQIRERQLGKQHSSITGFINNLAVLYDKMGLYEKAELLYLTVKNSWGNKFGKEHRLYANSLNNLAVLYTNMQLYETAKPLYLEAIHLSEKTLGKDHPNHAKNINNIALLYYKIGDYEKAESHFLTAIELRKNALGDNHPDYAASLYHLAKLYLKKGLYNKAYSLCSKSKNILENNFGNNHPDYIQNLNLLALINIYFNKYSEAEKLFIKANKIEHNLIMKSSQHLSERELLNTIANFNNSQNNLFSLLLINPTLNSTKCGYNNALFHKGFLLNAIGKMRRIALKDPESKDKYLQLRSLNRQLAADYAKPITDRKYQNELEEKINNLEKELARNIAGFKEAIQQVTWEDVQSKLKPNEAAIEFVQYNLQNDSSNAKTNYGAFILKPNQAAPTFVPLFTENAFTNLINNKKNNESNFINGIYTFKEKSIGSLLWKAIAIELEDVKTIYYSPVGQLNRINLRAIPINKNELLSDKFYMIQLNSTRQIVVSSYQNHLSNVSSALLYGGINFESSSAIMEDENRKINALNDIEKGRANTASNPITSIRSEKWKKLPWTEVEVVSLQLLLEDAGIKSKLLTADHATESSFKNMSKNNQPPNIIHLASHGFFFPNPNANKDTNTTNRSINNPGITFQSANHPLMRSGIVLAGGNQAWIHGQHSNVEKEDGILTAFEISQMDLSGTDLVVLSACDTGLGEIKGNEGVYGLQRAFKIAGTKNLIMSLWQVPDFHTQELMTNFYMEWLNNKKSTHQAFYAAQEEIRKKYHSPYYWAGFILIN